LRRVRRRAIGKIGLLLRAIELADRQNAIVFVRMVIVQLASSQRLGAGLGPRPIPGNTGRESHGVGMDWMPPGPAASYPRTMLRLLTGDDPYARQSFQRAVESPDSLKIAFAASIRFWCSTTLTRQCHEWRHAPRKAARRHVF
jgi:hypothetical protein